MYRAVIISCLIAVACAATVSPVHYGHKATRQATTASTNPAQTDNSQYITGFQYEKPLATTESNPSFFARMMPYLEKIAKYSKHTSNYLLQGLGVVFLATSAVGLVCSYTSVCTNLQLAALEQSGGRRMARSSGEEYPYLNEFTEILMRAMDNYVTTANVKQKREVGQ